MANYYAIIRTNYFTVTDEIKFREIVRSCSAAGDIEIFEPKTGSNKFGFGCFGPISGIPTEPEDPEFTDLDTFYYALQSVLTDGDAIIITEIGYEKLRYLVGACTVITSRDIQYINVCEKAVELAREMLSDNGFKTQMYY